MPTPPDIDALARRYVELWQDQITATANDPELQEGLARTIQLLGNGAAASALLWQNLWSTILKSAAHAGPAGNGGSPDAATRDTASTSADAPSSTTGAKPESSSDTGISSGTETAAVAPAERGPDVAQLEARIAILEERIRSLEGASGRADKRPRQRNPGRRTR